MRLQKKWKPAELTQPSMHLLRQFESDLQTIEDRLLVAVVQEPTEETEDRLTREEALERWMDLVTRLQNIRRLCMSAGMGSTAEMAGQCIALANELAADRNFYADEEDARRKQNAT